MDNKHKTIAEKEQDLLDKDEINRLKRMLKKCQICDEEKMKRIKYLENVITYLENKLEEH